MNDHESLTVIDDYLEYKDMKEKDYEKMFKVDEADYREIDKKRNRRLCQ